MAVLSETSIFDGRDSFPEMINDRFRDITTRILPYEASYEEFFGNIEENTNDAVARLIQCDRILVEDFVYEAREDLERAQNCVV